MRCGTAALLLGSVLACASAPPAERQVAAAPPLPERIMPTEVIPRGPDVELTPDGLVQVDAPEFAGQFFVLYPRPYLFRYDRIVLETPFMGYGGDFGGLPPHQEEELLAHLDRGIRDSLVDAGGWKLTERSGPGVLAVQISVLDLDLRGQGRCTLRMELLDSESGQPLARILEERALHTGPASSAGIDTKQLKSVFDRFAADVGRNLSSYHAIVREIQRREQAGET